MALEEPEHSVLDATDEYEIRHYPTYLVAEVDVEGDFSTAGNRAFRLLAGYIFGNNQGSRKMAMTAPVTSQEAGKKMAMTAPVTSTRSGPTDTSYTYAFVMERAYTLATLPTPTDPRVRLKEMPERVMAVRTYSGRWTETNYTNHMRTLLDALERDGHTVAGDPILARYDPPFMPWFMRRNEVMVPIGTVDVAAPESQAEIAVQR